MGHQRGAETADGVGENGLGGQLTVANGVEHGRMGTEVARPAHTDGGADSNGVAVDPALGSEVGNQTQRSAHSTKGGDGEGDLVRIVQAE